MAGDMDRDVPGSGSGWNEVQYGGLTMREASGIDNPSSSPDTGYSGYPTTSDSPGGRVLSGNNSLLYPIFTWGVAAVVFFHFGLQQSALSTFVGFIEASALVGVTIWANTAKGRNICEMFAIVGFLGAVVLGVLLFVAFKMGYIKQPPAVVIHQPIASHTKHNLHKLAFKTKE